MIAVIGAESGLVDYSTELRKSLMFSGKRDCEGSHCVGDV